MRLELLPTTETSRPFMSAADKCDFAKIGYREDEYLMHGTANVYAKGLEGAEVVAKDAPYANRCIVRYPLAEKASGNAIIEILNASTGMDIDRMWVLGKDYHIAKGDTYVAVTSKPITMFALKKFDPERYARISWANPRENQLPVSLLGNMGYGDTLPECENGLFWDMLVQLAVALRQGQVALDGAKIRRVYLTGWSQSGSYMVRYVNDLATLYNQRFGFPIFDGYLAGGTGYNCVPGLCQSDSPASVFSDEIKINHTAQPYIAVHTESENCRLGGWYSQQPDSDSDVLRYRRYEIPGSTHDAKYNMLDYYLGSDDQQRAGVVLHNSGMTNTPNDFPYEMVFHAAWDHLYRWVEDGALPPKVKRIEVAQDQFHNALDAYGNALGGYRLPPVALPVCTYHPISVPFRADYAMDCYLYGYRENFPVEKLKAMYGTLAHYQTLVEQKTDELIIEKLVLPQDRQTLIDRTVASAASAGLE